MNSVLPRGSESEEVGSQWLIVTSCEPFPGDRAEELVVRLDEVGITAEVGVMLL